MQSKDNTALSVRRQVQASTTLNRRYVKRPVRSTDVMVKVNKKPSQPQQQPQVSKLTAKEIWLWSRHVGFIMCRNSSFCYRIFC